MAILLPPSGEAGEARYQPLAEINVTPMVDVMLVLLIIFMVTAPLLTVGVPLDLPKTTAAELQQPKEPIVLSLDREGGSFIGNEPVAAADRNARLSRLAAEDPSRRPPNRPRPRRPPRSRSRRPRRQSPLSINRSSSRRPSIRRHSRCARRRRPSRLRGRRRSRRRCKPPWSPRRRWRYRRPTLPRLSAPVIARC